MHYFSQYAHIQVDRIWTNIYNLLLYWNLRPYLQSFISGLLNLLVTASVV
jgi:hypothetical protein